MRRIDQIVVMCAAVILAGTAAFYFARGRRMATEPLASAPTLGMRDKPLSPMDILKAPETTATETAGSPPDEDGVRTPPKEVIVYPEWQPGPTTVANAQPVTDNADYVRPRWSPVGLDIAFTRTDNRGLLVTGARKQDVRVLSTDPGVGEQLMWNVDGMSLLVREPDGQYSNIMITSEKYPAPPPPWPLYERDGVIYYQPDDERTPLRISGSQDRFTRPKLSPDETKALFIGRQTGIYIAAVDGSQVISVGMGSNPSWLPDSSGIVYDLPVTDGNTVIDSDLWYASAAGDEKTNLTKTQGVLEIHPAVSTDGDRIAFSSDGAIYVGEFRRPARPRR